MSHVYNSWVGNYGIDERLLGCARILYGDVMWRVWGPFLRLFSHQQQTPNQSRLVRQAPIGPANQHTRIARRFDDVEAHLFTFDLMYM